MEIQSERYWWPALAELEHASGMDVGASSPEAAQHQWMATALIRYRDG
jgi:hypothetical protein